MGCTLCPTFFCYFGSECIFSTTNCQQGSFYVFHQIANAGFQTVSVTACITTSVGRINQSAQFQACTRKMCTQIFTFIYTFILNNIRRKRRDCSLTVTSQPPSSQVFFALRRPLQAFIREEIGAPVSKHNISMADPNPHLFVCQAV